MRRFDQGIGLVAKLPLAIGELKLRSLQADAAGGLGAEPAMHVVVAKTLAGTAEIASGATGKHDARCKYRRCGYESSRMRSCSGQMKSAGHVIRPSAGD